MILKYCPMCHTQVLWFLFPGHVARHSRLLPDGQMTDHATMRPDERYEGSLAGIPQVYEHAECGGHTGMPEVVMRSYLANPFLYGRMFCCGCGQYIATDELAWTETSQNMADYFQELQEEYLKVFGEPPEIPGL